MDARKDGAATPAYARLGNWLHRRRGDNLREKGTDYERDINYRSDHFCARRAAVGEIASVWGQDPATG